MVKCLYIVGPRSILVRMRNIVPTLNLLIGVVTYI